MKQILSLTALCLILIIILTACSPGAVDVVEPLATEKPQTQPETLPTDAPDKTKPESAATSDPASSVNPSSDPISDWYGIPIMAGATQLQYTEAQLAFYSTATIDEISTYYINTLTQLGYLQSAVEDNQTGGVMLEFSNDTQFLIITILDMIEQRMVFMILS